MTLDRRMIHLMRGASMAVAVCVLSASAQAGEVFKSGWRLDPLGSSLTFQTVHSKTVTETHRFTALEGTIEPDGTTTVTIDLASVATRDDLRDTRMRFLLFETFKFPDAKITATLDESLLASLDDMGRLSVNLRATLDLHGFSREVTTKALAVMVDDDTVSILSTDPIEIRAEDFGFADSVNQLQDIYFGELLPTAAVSFNLVFDARPHGETSDQIAAKTWVGTSAIVNGSSVQAAPKEECLSKLRGVSPSRRLHFLDGSDQLTPESLDALAEMADAIRPCTNLKVHVAGHTDSRGDETLNQILSERRADHVAKHLVRLGLPTARVQGEGFGETRPIAPNDTAENRSKNRRIEFRVVEG